MSPSSAVAHAVVAGLLAAGSLLATELNPDESVDLESLTLQTKRAAVLIYRLLEGTD